MEACKKRVLLLFAVVFSFQYLPAETFAFESVGQIKFVIQGIHGSDSSALTALSVPLENAMETSGSLTAVAGTILTGISVEWTLSTFAATHYMQSTSGTDLGISATILDNAATELTTVEDFSSFLVGGEYFVVYAYTTLADLPSTLCHRHIRGRQRLCPKTQGYLLQSDRQHTLKTNEFNNEETRNEYTTKMSA